MKLAPPDCSDGSLFTIPSSDIPPLDRARKRLDDAQAEFEKAELAQDELALNMSDILTELRNARACVALLESVEIGRRR